MLESSLTFGVRATRRPARSLVATVAALTLSAAAWAGHPAGAGAAPVASPGVSHVTATNSGSTAVRLTWANPAAPGRLGTVVRYQRTPGAPRSPKDGTRAGRVGASGTALTVRGLRPATRYAFALFTSYGKGRYSPRTVIRITTAPDSVRLVQPFAHGSRVTITWLTPRLDTYAGTVVRYALGGTAPATPTAGTGVRLDGPHARFARLTGLAAGATYAVRIWTRDHAFRLSSPATTRFTLPAAGATAPTGTISGTVTDAAQHPLAGVTVTAWAAASPATGQATTDAAGHYSLTAPAGRILVLFGGADATGGGSDATGYQEDGRQLTLPAGQTRTENAALDPGAEITGTVTDAQGDPLAGVGVYPQLPSTYVDLSGFAIFFGVDTTAAPTTRSDGTFALKGLPPVAVQVCYATNGPAVTGGVADAVGYLGRCEHRTVAVAAGASRNLAPAALLPAATGRVTGTVTDAVGHAVAGVIVAVTSHDPRQDGSGYATTDGAGHYLVTGLPAGSYDVCADPTAAPVPAGSTGSALTCRFAAAAVTRGHTAVVDVELRPAGAVAGRVRGPHGAVAGALALVFSAGGVPAGSAVTDARGQYVVADLAPGYYRVCVDSGGAASGSPAGVLPGCVQGGDLVSVHRGTTRVGVDITLAAAGAVAGTVTGGAGSQVVVQVVRPGAEQPAAYALADDSGAYLVPGVPAGRYLVCADAFDETSGDTAACHHAAGTRGPAEVSVRAGRVTRSVGIALPVGGSITATVTDEGGNPVSGVDVVVVDACPDESCDTLPLFDPSRPTTVVGSGMTDARGRLRVGHLPSSGGRAKYAVCAFTYYGAATTGDPATGYLDTCTSYRSFGLAVAAGHDTPLALTLHPAGAVTGRVTDTAGHPLAGVRVLVSGSSSTDYYDASQLDGAPLGFVPEGPAGDVTTDADGSYVVPGVQPGKRTVCFDATDAVDVTGTRHPTGILGQCVGGRPGDLHTGTPVTVPAQGTLTGVDAQLSDGAVLAGRVVDRRTGAGVRQAEVLVFVGQTVVAGGGTDRSGHYRITQVPPGKERVCFVGYPYDPQCYDNVPWLTKDVPATAKVITTSAGATLTLKDARLRRA